MPMVVGVWLPRVLIPRSLIHSLTKSESFAVLVHELSHIRRNDPLWNLLYKIVTTLCWCHPLIWVAKTRYLQAREMSCDDYCVFALGSARSYGETLLKIASSQLNPSIVSGIAFARDSKIGSRINFISHSEGNMFCNSNGLTRGITLIVFVMLASAITSLSVSGTPVIGEEGPVPSNKAAATHFEKIRQLQVITDDDFYGMNCMHFSPDGEFLYASAWRTSTIHVFRVMGNDGELVPIQTFRHKHLRNNSSVRISPDGKWAASANGFGMSVILLSRDAATGKLTYADHFAASTETTGLRYFNDSVFSPDSRFLVVASMRAHSTTAPPATLHLLEMTTPSSDEYGMEAFENQPPPTTEGALSLFEIQSDAGLLKWCQTETGTNNMLVDARSIAFSEDGQTVVTCAVGSHTLVVLDLDLIDKDLSIRQVLRNQEQDIYCLQKAFGSRFSPDGRFVYTTGGRTANARRMDGAPMGVGVFQFDDRHRLRVVQQITNDTAGCAELGGGNELEVSKDGKYVITTLTDNASVAVFSRDQATGQLDLVDVIKVPEDPSFSPSGLAIGNDSRTIFVSSEDSKSIYRFKIFEGT